MQAYSYILVPTYPGGHIGINMGSLGPNLEKPNREIPDNIQDKLQYYNSDMHSASFVLPNFTKKMFKGI